MRLDSSRRRCWPRCSSPACGCSLLRDAEISSRVPGGNLMTGTLECWLELTFSGAPGGDPRDVVVESDSIVMPGPQRVGWDFIAQHDQVRKGDFRGYRLNSDTTVDSAPPLETPIRVKVPLKALDRVQLNMGDDPERAGRPRSWLAQRFGRRPSSARSRCRPDPA